MICKSTIAVCAILLSGCGTRFYLEAGAGANSGNGWNDCNGTGVQLGIGRAGTLAKDQQGELIGEIGWTHYSQLECGAPANDRSESTLDHFGGKVRYLFNE